LARLARGNALLVSPNCADNAQLCLKPTRLSARGWIADDDAKFILYEIGALFLPDGHRCAPILAQRTVQADAQIVLGSVEVCKSGRRRSRSSTMPSSSADTVRSSRQSRHAVLRSREVHWWMHDFCLAQPVSLRQHPSGFGFGLRGRGIARCFAVTCWWQLSARVDFCVEP
jgi:hypothetical protein